jgi:NAD(P)-dependent dehydrogenase (short-subunit alcohol dehydrogenase family)
MGKLEEKVAIVTGGSRGIGRAVAMAFAREGAVVAIAAVSDRETLQKVEGEIARLGRPALGVMADVSQRNEVDAMVQRVAENFGRIDILVNNAGILHTRPLEDIPEEEWDRTISVHLKGTFNCTQSVLPFMKEQKRGKIINIAAPSALRGVYGVADYAAAKGGIVAFTRNAAHEFKPYNIQVNCISPVADTRMTEALIAFRREQLGVSSRDRPFLAPEAITPAYVFFACSDSDYVSGQLLEVGNL